MTKRDRAIIADLERFGVMSRDHLIKLHFKGLRNQVSNANAVMLRLFRQGRVNRNADYSQFIYFPIGGGIRKDSGKLRHYLAIVDTYIEMQKLGEVSSFISEPKYGKGFAEPDAFTIWKGSPFFIEVQLSRISQREVAQKVKRYEALASSGIIAREPWQPAGKPIFPSVLFLSETRYAIENSTIKFIQIRKISNLFESNKIKSSGIRLRLA
ncbi:replication-relaxation family protein [Pseudogracilibacillus sp. SE30717A]|uniref:replication-relaxation family protein n=1 Tax=Pseudogracilibacillus sp. SE30717A TaxID=3098293 RepID=UPI00300E1E72